MKYWGTANSHTPFPHLSWRMMDASKSNYPERLKRHIACTHFSYIGLSKIGSIIYQQPDVLGPMKHYSFVFWDQREIKISKIFSSKPLRVIWVSWWCTYIKTKQNWYVQVLHICDYFGIFWELRGDRFEKKHSPSVSLPRSNRQRII